MGIDNKKYAYEALVELKNSISIAQQKMVELLIECDCNKEYSHKLVKYQHKLIKMHRKVTNMLVDVYLETINIESDNNAKLIEVWEHVWESEGISKPTLSEDKNNKSVVSESNKKYNSTVKKSAPKPKKEKDILGKSDVTYVDKVDFTDINKVDISKYACELPVTGVIEKKNTYYAKVEVVDSDKFVLKHGSVIQLSSKSKINNIGIKDVINKRNKYFEEGKLELSLYGDNGAKKLIVAVDIVFDSLNAVKCMILGRKLTEADANMRLFINGVDFDTYKITGETT